MRCRARGQETEGGPADSNCTNHSGHVASVGKPSLIYLPEAPGGLETQARFTQPFLGPGAMPILHQHPSLSSQALFLLSAASFPAILGS